MTRFSASIWNDSRNADEAAFKMGLRTRSVIVMASKLRKAGANVKRFNKPGRWPKRRFRVGGTI